MMVGMLGLAVATVGFSLASNYWVLILARIGQGSAGGASWYDLIHNSIIFFMLLKSSGTFY